jgi:hypothetical protein
MKRALIVPVVAMLAASACDQAPVDPLPLTPSPSAELTYQGKGAKGSRVGRSAASPAGDPTPRTAP